MVIRPNVDLRKDTAGASKEETNVRYPNAEGGASHGTFRPSKRRRAGAQTAAGNNACHRAAAGAGRRFNVGSGGRRRAADRPAAWAGRACSQMDAGDP